MRLPPLPPGGRGHDWMEVPEGTLPPECTESWPRFEDRYGVRNVFTARHIPSATHWCRRCGILVPSDGVRDEDEECDPLLVESVMES